MPVIERENIFSYFQLNTVVFQVFSSRQHLPQMVSGGLTQGAGSSHLNRTHQKAKISEVHKTLLFTDVFAQTDSSLMGHVAGNDT